jgi:carboxypeptidase Q
MYSMAVDEGFDNVRLETVKDFTRWERGTEELWLHDPRPDPTRLKVIGLGGTVPGNVKAEAIVVDNFDELEKRKDEVSGKIVVFNEPWTTYRETVVYRTTGAWRAAKYGAVAALVRSVTPESI